MKLFYASIFLIAASCQTDPKKVIEQNEITLSDDTISEIAIRETPSVLADTTISYNDFDSVETGEYDFNWVPTESDLFTLSTDDYGVIFSSETIVPVSISYRSETSITIQGEGPHCDLINWKHGATSWEKLIFAEEDIPDKSTDFRYVYKKPPMDLDWGKLPFPETDMAEISTAVKSSCGEGWANHMKECKTPGEYPCNVGVSSYIFRISYKHHKNEIRHLYMKIPVAMGC